MKTITIKQPRAQLIVEGIKDIENRTWPTSYRGRVLIHAGAKWDDNHRNMSKLFTPEQWEYLSKENQTLMVGGILPVSAVIGSVEIVDCVINHPSIWAEKTTQMSPRNTYNWVLANAIKFPEPIPAKGKQSFWDCQILFSQKEIEKYYVRCEFDDTCDVCDDPQHGSYAAGYTNDECGCEVDYYICGKCASQAIPRLIEEEKKLDEHIRSLNR